MVLSPVEYQTVIGVTHYSHGPLPFLLLILFCLAWTIRNHVAKYAWVVVLSFLSTFTGYGMCVGLLCPVIMAIDLWTRGSELSNRERWAGVISLCLSALVLICFFYGFRSSDGVCPPHAFFNPGTGLPTPYPNPIHYLLFMAFMFGNFVGLKATLALIPAILGGTAILFIVFAGLVASLRRNPHQVVPFTLIAFSLLFAVMAAQGRMCLGLSAALGSRYMIYLVPAFLGLYLLAITIADRIWRTVGLLVVASLALMSSVFIHGPDRNDMTEIRRLKIEWSQCYVSSHNLLECNRDSHAPSYSYPDTIQSQLDFLERNRLNFFSTD
jgi:hypothetical protein